MTDATRSNAPRSDEDILATVLRTLRQIAPEVDVATLSPTASLRDQVDLDSMDFLNFVIGLSQSSGVQIAEADYPQLATLHGCVAYLAAHSAQRP